MDSVSESLSQFEEEQKHFMTACKADRRSLEELLKTTPLEISQSENGKLIQLALQNMQHVDEVIEFSCAEYKVLCNNIFRYFWFPLAHFFQSDKAGLQISLDIFDDYQDLFVSISNCKTRLNECVENSLDGIARAQLQRHISHQDSYFETLNQKYISPQQQEKIEDEYQEYNKAKNGKKLICEVEEELSNSEQIIEMKKDKLNSFVQSVSIKHLQEIRSKVMEQKESFKENQQNQQQAMKLQVFDWMLNTINPDMKRQQLGQSLFHIFLVYENSKNKSSFTLAIDSIKQMVKQLQEDKHTEDTFSLIQYSSESRIVIPQTAIKNFNVESISYNSQGSGYDPAAAFESINSILNSSENLGQVQIIFFSGKKSRNLKYVKVLKSIKKQYYQYQISMFCIRYEKASNYELKKCLFTMNGDTKQLKISNGSTVKTQFRLDQINELAGVFRKIKEELNQKSENKEQQDNGIQSQQETNEDIITLLKEIFDFANQIESQRITLELMRKQLKDFQKLSEPTISPDTLKQQICDLNNSLTRLGFPSFPDFLSFQEQVKKTGLIEQRQIQILKQLKQNTFYSYEVIRELKSDLSNFQCTLEKYNEPTVKQTYHRFLELQQQSYEKCDSSQLITRVISEELPSFEKRVDDLSDPELFKQKVLASLLSEEMWSMIAELCYVNTSRDMTKQTFDDFTQGLLIQTYGHKKTKFMEKILGLGISKQRVAEIKKQIYEVQNRMSSNSQNEILTLQEKEEQINREYQLRIDNADGDLNQIEILEEEKAEKIAAQFEMEQEKREKENEDLEEEMEQLKENLEQAEDQLFYAEIEETEIKEVFISEFKKEYDLIEIGLKSLRTVSDKIKISYSEFYQIKLLNEFLENTKRKLLQLLPQEEQSCYKNI